MTHAGAVTCPCVADHRPPVADVEVHHIWPRGDGGPDTEANRTPICPTSHSAVHHLLGRYRRAGGTPPWEVRQHYNPQVRHLAAMGWAAMAAR